MPVFIFAKKVLTIYEDGQDYQQFFPGKISVNLTRNSRIEPLPNPEGEIRFKIVWLSPFSGHFGLETVVDADGSPFTTKRQAQRCEVRMLHEYYGLPVEQI